MMKLAEVVSLVVGPDARRRVHGVRRQPPRSPRRPTCALDVRSPRAVSLLMSAPGQLGLARAYVTGELEVHGDLYTGARPAGPARRSTGPPCRTACASTARSPRSRCVAPPRRRRRCGSAGRGTPSAATRRDPPPLRRQQHVLRAGCSARRWPTPAPSSPRPDATLEEAQDEKFDLVCRKLGLAARACGCSTSAAAGAASSGTPRSTTASRRHRRHALAAAGRVGRRTPSSARAWPTSPQIRLQDYRDVPERGFDAISSIGLTEHIGVANYPAYFAFLEVAAQPGRPAAQPLHHPHRHALSGRRYKNGFINRYVFPDGELVPVGRIIVRDARTPASRCATRRTCASTTR